MFGAVKRPRSASPTIMYQPKMPFPRKLNPILSFLTIGVIIWLFRPLLPVPTISWTPAPESRLTQILLGQDTRQKQKAIVAQEQEDPQANLRPVTNNPFKSGATKPVGMPYTKTLVIPRTSREDVSWIAENFGRNEYLQAAIYTVDDVTAELHPPKNKGHEVMVYLTYIIDHYHNLTDVNIFMHSHRYAWHNNELLDSDSVQMVSRLSAERVQREGFMNMRCSWEPGCPSWMHPGNVQEDINKQEETMLAKSWSELFPLDPIPNVLAQPCCAQFAISRDRIQSLPLARYVFYRDWLLRTSLSDYISGRVWEYVWQFVFTGKPIVCPAEHICYCDGFGVCFGGAEKYEEYRTRERDRWLVEQEARNHGALRQKWETEPELLTEEEKAQGRPDSEKGLQLEKKINELMDWCDKRKQEAKEQGDVAMYRAREAGRPWSQGDGF
ncbi:hypothetical protein N431DRAFT_499955 [Stipitochalara longipes BDJ]|nr:hypothetical protein N431DRAFT_499955 [Stipitochalara longipes BDJ]